MCKKCRKKICCCPPKAISAKLSRGKQGPRGPRGPKGADATPPAIVQVVGQSALWGGIDGAVGGTGVGTLFTNLQSNFFVTTQKFFSLSIGLTVVSTLQHKVIAYFKKNGVQVGPTYEKTMFPKDYLFFQTELLPFINTDALALYIESTSVDCVVHPGHLINYRLI